MTDIMEQIGLPALLEQLVRYNCPFYKEEEN